MSVRIFLSCTLFSVTKVPVVTDYMPNYMISYQLALLSAVLHPSSLDSYNPFHSHQMVLPCSSYCLISTLVPWYSLPIHPGDNFEKQFFKHNAPNYVSQSSHYHWRKLSGNKWVSCSNASFLCLLSMPLLSHYQAQQRRFYNINYTGWIFP